MKSQILEGLTKRGLKKVGLASDITVSLGEKRLNVCKTCDTFVNGRCDESRGGCGCYMKSKVLVEKAECPKNKW